MAEEVLQSNYRVTASVTRTIKGAEVTKDLGTFDTLSGGEVDSEEKLYYAGGMAVPKQVGGKRKVGNVTIGRAINLSRDQENEVWLMNGVGKAKFIINKQSLDIDGVVFGKPLVYQGKLKMVTPTEVDSESDDLATYELEMSSATVTR